MQIFSETNVDFMGRRRLALVFSVVLLVLAVASLVMRGLSFGIDFTGGTLLEVSYPEAVVLAKAR